MSLGLWKFLQISSLLGLSFLFLSLGFLSSLISGISGSNSLLGSFLSDLSLLFSLIGSLGLHDDFLILGNFLLDFSCNFGSDSLLGGLLDGLGCSLFLGWSWLWCISSIISGLNLDLSFLVMFLVVLLVLLLDRLQVHINLLTLVLVERDGVDLRVGKGAQESGKDEIGRAHV